MLYGVCTWIFGDLPLGELLERLAGMGFDGVELLGDTGKYEPRRVRELLEGTGLRVFSLTPLDVDLAHPDHRARREALDYYLGLLDFAAEIGAPLIACHGAVGRVRPITTLEEEEALFLEGVSRIVERAGTSGIKVAIEILNRYESHLLNTACRAKEFVEEIGSPYLGILLDTYHMNIEEADPVSAIYEVGDRLFLFHVADSNRRGIGRGHIPFPQIFRALGKVGYAGPAVLECTAPGPDPFTPEKGGDWRDLLFREVAESLAHLKLLGELAARPL